MSSGAWRPTYARVDLGNIAHNIRLYRDLVGPSCRIMAVVKADAYGHGDLEVSRTALGAGAERLGVALVEEAERLREAGLDAPIHLLFEPPVAAAPRVAELDLTPSVYTRDYAMALSAACSSEGKSIKVHIKVDTGMHRVGVEPAAGVDFVEEVSRLPGLELEGVYSHLAMGSEAGNPFNKEQLHAFERMTEELRGRGITIPIRHIAASGAAASLPEARLDMIRLGIAMYGLLPGESYRGLLDLRPALSLRTRISHVFRAEAGEAVSYGRTYRFDRPSWVAVLPVGYADGFSRALSNRWRVLIGGKLYPAVGTVCMDLFMVELGDDLFQAGEPAVVIGGRGEEEIGVERMAETLGTINYEVVCDIGKRVPRVYGYGL